MGKLVDLTNKRFGRLIVVNRGNNQYTSGGNAVVTWNCICDCGNEKNVRTGDLKSGKTSSCGCLFLETLSNISHKKNNQYDLSGKFGIGYTAKGEEFYFDLEDYEKINKYCWHIKSDGYITTLIYFNKDYKKQIFLHRLIMNCNDDFLIDHMNHNKNDNRKNNLRMVTVQQNNMNNSLRKDNISNATGVFWNKKNNIWQAQIRVNSKAIHLGCFINKQDAIKSRKQAEEKYFGEYSYDNSIAKVGVIND